MLANDVQPVEHDRHGDDRKDPPITGAGIAAKKADNLAKKPKTINQLPAAMKTRLEATPVMEITPALVE